MGWCRRCRATLRSSSTWLAVIHPRSRTQAVPHLWPDLCRPMVPRVRSRVNCSNERNMIFHRYSLTLRRVGGCVQSAVPFGAPTSRGVLMCSDDSLGVYPCQAVKSPACLPWPAPYHPQGLFVGFQRDRLGNTAAHRVPFHVVTRGGQGKTQGWLHRHRLRFPWGRWRRKSGDGT